MAPALLEARIPIALDCPESMVPALESVLSGEYETGHFGENLAILDIGANVGAFAVWASLRWPGSRIACYEAHPGTFALLERNTRHLAGVVRHHAAVWPTEEERILCFGRYPGDGEAGIVRVIEGMFARVPAEEGVFVPTVHPRTLPRADIVKLDVEGAEPEILEHLDLAETSLLLLEYHSDAGKARILELTRERFAVLRAVDHPWRGLMGRPEYRADLADDHFGLLHLVAREGCRLHRLAER
jgi:FkbM family methyltransferase